jgi:N6-adenosine-specific RNA methylase IME4
MDALPQRALFGHDAPAPAPHAPVAAGFPRTTTSLQELVAANLKFRTVYADPPWDYDNRASRGAARNHYRTMTLEQIRAEPVNELADDEAHLHLWTTNGFLREAIDLVGVWGFEYKSCFVWVKPELGCGNYWRVSHEFLLLGVRGNLPFADHCQKSWLEASRMEHSRKPGNIRMLLEKVSSGPYLEMYGRAEVPDSDWTVYGNQVERRLF